jgi:hypothetical protein
MRFDDDNYEALMRCVTVRRAKGEDIDFTKLVNELIRMSLPLPIWKEVSKKVEALDDLSKRVGALEEVVEEIKRCLSCEYISAKKI